MNKYLKNQFKYDLLLLVVILIWGFNFPILKHVLDTLHPFILNMLRFVVSILALLLIYAFQKESFFRTKPQPKFLLVICLLGLLGYFVYQFLFIIGINITTAGNSAIIMASSPVWTALSAHFFTSERLSRLAWSGLSLTIAGAIFISVIGGRQLNLGAEFMLGNGLILLASMCWGVYTTFSKPATHYVNPIGLTLIGLLFSFPLNVLVALPHLDSVSWSSISPNTWLAIVYSGGLSTGVAVVAWTISVKQVGATHTAVFGNLVPLVALIASYFILNEVILYVQVIGGSLIVGGLILMRINR